MILLIKPQKPFRAPQQRRASQAHDPESAQEWSEWLMLGIRCLPDHGLGTCIVSIITHTLASARIILGVRGLPLRACPGGQAAHGPNPTKTGGGGGSLLANTVSATTTMHKCSLLRGHKTQEPGQGKRPMSTCPCPTARQGRRPGIYTLPSQQVPQ